MALRDVQARLISLGFEPGTADSRWGARTEAAVNAALDKLEVLSGAVAAPPTLLRPEWLPPAQMDRVIAHWTAGSLYASAVDRQHYHFLIEGDGKVVKGDVSVALNQSPVRPGYAEHTLNCNGGSIGIAVCGMFAAQESPWHPGPYPFSRLQWLKLAEAIADLCRFYRIPVTTTAVLTHAEVQGTLGIRQRGKWDISRLPFDPDALGATAVGDMLRAEIREVMT